MAYTLDQAVLVTDIPYLTEDVDQLTDKLNKYFGKRGNGGGDIETILCPVGGSLAKAIVVFESTEVPENVVKHGIHSIEEETINVKLLPSIYTHIEVDLDDYYWDIMCREKADDLIKNLETELGSTSVFHSKHKIARLQGNHHQLEAIREIIPKLAGIGITNKATATTITSEVLARSVEVAEIPFISDNEDKQKKYLRDAVSQQGDQPSMDHVEDIILPIKGNMGRAIIVFKSIEEKDIYIKQATHSVMGEKLKVINLPEVYRKTTVTIDRLYRDMMPRNKLQTTNALLTANFGHGVTFNGNEIIGPFARLPVVLPAWMESIGLPFVMLSDWVADNSGETCNGAEGRNELLSNKHGASSFMTESVPNRDVQPPTENDLEDLDDPHQDITNMVNDNNAQGESKKPKLDDIKPTLKLQPLAEEVTQNAGNVGSEFTNKKKGDVNDQQEATSRRVTESEHINPPYAETLGITEENTITVPGSLPRTDDNDLFEGVDKLAVERKDERGAIHSTVKSVENVEPKAKEHVTSDSDEDFVLVKRDTDSDSRRNLSELEENPKGSFEAAAETKIDQSKNQNELKNPKLETRRAKFDADNPETAENGSINQSKPKTRPAVDNVDQVLGNYDPDTSGSRSPYDATRKPGSPLNVHCSKDVNINPDHAEKVSANSRESQTNTVESLHDKAKTYTMAAVFNVATTCANDDTLKMEKPGVRTMDRNEGVEPGGKAFTKDHESKGKDTFTIATAEKSVPKGGNGDLQDDQGDKSVHKSTRPAMSAVETFQSPITISVDKEYQTSSGATATVNDVGHTKELPGSDDDTGHDFPIVPSVTEPMSEEIPRDITNNVNLIAKDSINVLEEQPGETSTSNNGDESFDAKYDATSQHTHGASESNIRRTGEEVHVTKTSSDKRQCSNSGNVDMLVSKLAGLNLNESKELEKMQADTHVNENGDSGSALIKEDDIKPQFHEKTCSKKAQGEDHGTKTENSSELGITANISDIPEPDNGVSGTNPAGITPHNTFKSTLSLTEPDKKAQTSTALAQDKFDDFVSVDAITYKYLRKTHGEKLQQLERKFHVFIEIQTPDQHTSTDQIALFKPQKNASSEDMVHSREEFIQLYQEVFYNVERISLKCDGLPNETGVKAVHETELKAKTVVIFNHQKEYIFCGDKKATADAIAIFRENAGIKPKLRKLKQAKSTFDGSSDGTEHPVTFSKATNASKDEGSPSGNLPSVFNSKDGLHIIVLQDDITKQNVDIIVNAANGRLNHNGGVAGAISRAAGRQLQSDCDKIMWGRKALKIGQCMETKGYKLPCKHVIHAIGPVFQGQKNPGAFFRELTNTFMSIFQLAESKNAQSLAIPLISSGNFGGPKDVCASALATALFNFSSLGARTSIQQMFLVNIDQEATMTLQSTLSDLFPMSDDRETKNMKTPSDSALNATNAATFNTNEGIEVLVVTGDITKGSFNAIVNAANGELLHGGGVAAAIARAAGKRIQDESKRIITQRKAPLKVGECEVTDGYNLGCKVVHAVGPVYNKCRSDEEFYNLLEKTFSNAIRHANIPIEAKEVAIPLISSGIYGGPMHICAAALARAVTQFSKVEKNLAIRRIWLVNIDEEATKVVREAFGDIFKPQPSVTGFAGCIKTKSGIQIQGLCGDISQQNVEAIVNPTTPTLQHNGGITGSISDAAGYKLQQRCNYIFKTERNKVLLGIGETVVTDNFDLPCKHIIHTFAPTFTPSAPSSFYGLLLKTYLSCLQCANSFLKVGTVSFPLLSSGSTGGPNETSAKALADAVTEFERSTKTSSLVKINIVCKDEAALAAVQNTVSAYFSSEKETDRCESPNIGNEKTDDKRVIEHVFQTPENMEIRLRMDNIAKQSTDVIFNYTDTKLTNISDASQQLCLAAGPAFQQECNDIVKKRKLLSPGNFVSTKGHALLCNDVIHVSPPLRDKKTNEGFISALTRTYVSSLLLSKQTLRAKSVALSIMQSKESLEFDSKVLATALNQFSRQLKSTASSVSVYVVCSTLSEVEAIKKALSTNFTLVKSYEIERHGLLPIQRRDQEQCHQQTDSHNEDMAQITTTGTASAARLLTSNAGSYADAITATEARQSAIGHRGQIPSSVTHSARELPKSNQTCQLCKNHTGEPHVLEGCKHKFCTTCVRDKVTPRSKCLECESLYGLISETNLGGQMKYYQKTEWQLEGVSQRGAIVMEFKIKSGTQNTAHPSPGDQFKGMTVQAYLPDTKEGREVLFLLRLAFLSATMFKVSSPVLDGDDYRVELAGIPLKTQTRGGKHKCGYPDLDYLPTVKKILKDKGVTYPATDTSSTPSSGTGEEGTPL